MDVKKLLMLFLLLVIVIIVSLLAIDYLLFSNHSSFAKLDSTLSATVISTTQPPINANPTGIITTQSLQIDSSSTINPLSPQTDPTSTITPQSPQIDPTSTVELLPIPGGSDASVNTAASSTPPNLNHDNGAPVILAAGDIAACDSPGDEETSALISKFAGGVIALGDNAYESGTNAEYKNCYDPSWGQFKARTFPTAGNHDYLTVGAAGYYDYFGTVAGAPGEGYYSYDIGAWHIIVLNSNCSDAGGCSLKSPQIQWLQSDLAAHSNLCTLAYWHHPRFSSGQHGDNPRVGTFWDVLYQAGADVVLNGHDHDYERFAPQTPAGLPDRQNGIQEFVVGTGGKNLTSIISIAANSEVRNDSTWGVLKVTLHPSGYDWRFIPVAGQTFTDSGSAACH